MILLNLLLDAAIIGKDSMVSAEFAMAVGGGIVATGGAFGAVKWGLNKHISLTELSFANMKESYDDKIKTLKDDFEKEYTKVQERFIESQREKRKIKEELKGEIQVCHDRIREANRRIEKNQDEFQAEIKKVDRELGEIKAVMTGMNNTLIEIKNEVKK
jgi:septal ring factor EnvC (AmiA/AmiB activator)